MTKANSKRNSIDKSRWVFFNTLYPLITDKWPSCRYVWLSQTGHESAQINFILRSTPGKICFLRVEETLQFTPESELYHIPDYQKFHLKERSQELLTKKIAFFPASDTIAKSMLPIIQRISQHTEIRCYLPHITNENADKVLDSKGIPYSKFNTLKLFIDRPDILIMGNDWSGEAKYIVALCRLLRIKTICLQESIIDLKDQNVRRMKWTDLAFVMGISAVQQLDRKLYFNTGNPRYELLNPDQTSLNSPKAFINCNFTYGVEEQIRFKWLDQVVSSLEEANIEYLISQHPRDKGDLSKYKTVYRSSAEIVHSQLKKCTFVISRFSSIIHEALFMGKPVIYYNPHKEIIGYEFYFDNSSLFLCLSADELKQILTTIISRSHLDQDDIEAYLAVHCNLTSVPPSDIIHYLLLNLSEFEGDGLRVNLFQGIYFYTRQYMSRKKKRFQQRWISISSA